MVSTSPTSDAVLQQIKQEHKESLDYVQVKREAFRRRLRMYNNQRKNRDKLSVTTLYSTMNVLLAIYYTDQLTVKFSGREKQVSEQAQRWDMLAQFDHEEMGLDVKNYVTQWDRLFFGVGIRSISSWDDFSKTPIVRTIDPLSWYPDPRGGMDESSFRWHGFDVVRRSDEMTESLGFIEANVKRLGDPVLEDGELALTRQAREEAQGLSAAQNEAGSGGSKNAKAYQCLDWLTIIDGHKYLITVDQKMNLILRMNKIEAVAEDEKKDSSRIPFPIILNYYSPNREDPFGTSVSDLVEDKQMGQSVIANLRLSYEKARLYPMYMVDRTRILNRRDLDFGFNKIIPVNGPVEGAVAPLQKDLQGASAGQQISRDLSHEVHLATGADETQAGIVSGPDTSATEIQQKQANANLRFILGTKVNSWGEKRFWKMWMRAYRKYLRAQDEKVVEIDAKTGSRFLTVTREDLITDSDPRIKIVSRTEANAERQRDLLTFQQSVPLILSDPQRPEAAKKYAERRMFRLQGCSEDEIMAMSPPSPNEMKARSENVLLSEGMKVDVDIQMDDHLSHLIVHDMADETPECRAHKAKHEAAYILSGQAVSAPSAALQRAGDMRSLAQQSQSQLSSQASAEAARSPSPTLSQT